MPFFETSGGSNNFSQNHLAASVNQVFYGSMVLTVALRDRQGDERPGYVADGYSVSHSDRPRETMETDEEAAGYRLPKDDAAS